MFTEIVYETLTKFIRYTLFSSSSSSRGISIVAFLIPSVFHNLLFQFVFKIRITIYIYPFIITGNLLEPLETVQHFSFSF